MIVSKPKPIDFSLQQLHSRFNEHELSSYIWKRLTRRELIVHTGVQIVSQFKMFKRGFRESRTILESSDELTLLNLGEVCYNLREGLM